MKIEQIILDGIFKPDLPISLELNIGTLECNALLRLLPPKRAVFKATLFEGNQSKPCILKIFSSAAHRQFKEEFEAHVQLEQSDIHCPKMIDHGTYGDLQYIVYRFVKGKSLSSIWKKTKKRSARQKVLSIALAHIAHMHNQHMVQTDLHLDNFLYRKKKDRITTLDSASINQKPILNTDDKIKNLSLFISQFNLNEQKEVFNNLEAYFHALESSPNNDEFSAFQHKLAIQTMKMWDKRSQIYFKKVLRSSTQFEKLSNRHREVIYERSPSKANKKIIESFMHKPTEFFSQSESLKSGNSSSVYRIHSTLIDEEATKNKSWVIKEYKHKDVYRFLSRSWRMSRAFRAWQFGHYLIHCGIDTPKPLAVYRKKRFGLTTVSYLLTEYDSHQNLYQSIDNNQILTQKQMNNLQSILHILDQEQIRHGDFKASNILASKNRIILIDLDGIKKYSSVFGSAIWKWIRQKDKLRLSKNWSKSHPIQKQLDEIDQKSKDS